MSSQLLILDSNIDLENVVVSTGLDMQEHDVAMHENVKHCVGYG